MTASASLGQPRQAVGSLGLEDFVPELPGGDDGVDPEGEHHQDDDDFFGRNFAQIRRVWHQSPVEADHGALGRHPGVGIP
jgi:hypothetical protein